jgi:hypothetical protein
MPILNPSLLCPAKVPEGTKAPNCGFRHSDHRKTAAPREWRIKMMIAVANSF